MASRHSEKRERRNHTLRLVLKNELAELDRMQAEIARFGERASLAQRDVQHCILACDELITNIISYGYETGGEREIVCELSCDADTLRLSLVDDALPYNPLDRADPDVTLTLEEREPGGLGIYFVKQVMDEVRYERDGSFNKLTLSKRRIDGGHDEH